MDKTLEARLLGKESVWFWMCGTDPDLNRNAINYRDNHKHRDAITINTKMQRK